MLIGLSKGERFRIARRRAGLTQGQVASLLGRPQNAVARWEAGDGPPARVWREAGLVDPGGPTAGEAAMVLRERLGLTVDEARALVRHGPDGLVPAAESGRVVSHVYVLRMEKGQHSLDLDVYARVLKEEAKRVLRDVPA